MQHRTRGARPVRGWQTWLLLAAVAGLMPGCTARRPPAAPLALLASYVVLADGGQALARAVTAQAQCPQIWIDGAMQPMRPRAAPQTVAARPGQAKPTVFPQLVCEAPLPPGTHAARIGARLLPLGGADRKKIVVLGDTGCRIKSADKVFQACDDPQQWPFAAVAAAAAREAPDLVIHVGDYHYRESECPLDQPCAHSVWGYGWDAWDADFFRPAQALLAAAPWVVVRGNHEECARAGQGWFRLLDPRPFEARRSCDEARDDADADFSDPYAVPLGDGWQLIVFDSALASRPLDLRKDADRHRLERYQDNLRQVAALAQVPGMHSLFLSHHPVLGFAVEAQDGAAVHFGNPALLEAMRSLSGSRYFPPGIEASLHGHVHSFQAIDFSSGHPAALVAGHGGDNLDADLPDSGIAAAYASVPGVQIGSVAHASSFGYLLLERDDHGWIVRARRRDGSALALCALRQAHLACDSGAPVVHPAPAKNL